MAFVFAMNLKTYKLAFLNNGYCAFKTETFLIQLLCKDKTYPSQYRLSVH